MEELAVKGGTPVRTKGYPENITIGDEECQAALDVLKNGKLSGFYASPDDRFYGGPSVRQFEDTVSNYFGVKHTTSFNSATSALHAAVYAAGVHEGDEVIVSPYTMSASATSILMQNGVPIFADIDPQNYGLDPKSVESKITDKTKAIMTVNIFGGPCRLPELRKIADKHNLVLIEDCAQSPGATIDGQYTGTFGDIGVMSLNCHKAVQTGEGGAAITNNADFDMRLKLIRNHGEVVVGKLEGSAAHDDCVGYNYRLSELQAAIGIEQWKKLDQFNDHRIQLCHYISEELSSLEGLHIPQYPSNQKHVFYVYPLRIDAKELGVSRAAFSQAVRAEGIPLREGYVQPLYMAPIYKRVQKKWGINYDKGLCPITETMHFEELTTFHQIYNSVSLEDIQDVVKAIKKVHAQRNRL